MKLLDHSMLYKTEDGVELVPLSHQGTKTKVR